MEKNKTLELNNKILCNICNINPRRLRKEYCDPCKRKQWKRENRVRNRIVENKRRNLPHVKLHETKLRHAIKHITNAKYRARDIEKRKYYINFLGSKCITCGEHQIEFLNIDHVNNDGAEERKKFKTTNILYILSKKTELEIKERYQLLCYNCNWIKYMDSLKLNNSRNSFLARKNALELKNIILEKYGGSCNCCGITYSRILTVDHIDGNGANFRRVKRLVGSHFHRWLRDNNFPKDNYQILCRNCNSGKRQHKHCPHQKE